MYTPIRIGTLRGNETVLFDVFIKISEKYVHYIKKGEPFEKERLDRLKQKGAKKLFVLSQDETFYFKYLDRAFENAKISSASVEEKASIVSDGLVTLGEAATEKIATKDGYSMISDQIKSVVGVLQKDSKAVISKILESTGVNADNFEHSAVVSSLSIGLGTILGLSEIELQRLGIAALLHDIALPELETLNTDKLSDEQKKAKWEHPLKGREMLNGKPYIDTQILDLVLEHEEIGEGMGFPNKRNIKTLSLSSQILSLANHFDLWCREKQKKPAEVADEYLIATVGKFELDMIKKLVGIAKEKT